MYGKPVGKDAFFYTYSGYSTRSNNFSNAGPHAVHVKNNLYEAQLLVVGWTVKKGKLEEDFTKNVVRPGLFNTAKLTPINWSKGDAVQGAVVFRIENTDNYYTLTFEDPYLGNGKQDYKGYLMEGNNPEAAIASLTDQTEVQVKQAKYYIDEFGGRPRTVIEFV